MLNRYKKMYCLIDRRPKLLHNIHNKLLIYKQVLKPVWIYCDYGDAQNRLKLRQSKNFKIKYFGTYVVDAP